MYCSPPTFVFPSSFGLGVSQGGFAWEDCPHALHGVGAERRLYNNCSQSVCQSGQRRGKDDCCLSAEDVMIK